MGTITSSNWATRAKVVEHIIQRNDQFECLAHKLAGNVLWSVWQVSEGKTSHRYIRCDLLKKYKTIWGYKDMEESMHPYYYSCPLKYLEMVPEVANQEWRDLVGMHHAIRAIDLRPGMIVGINVDGIPALKVIQTKPLAGETRDGHRFKFSRNNMTGAVYETWPKEA